MNKNGFLLAEETLKIIIAVIAIGFLVYFLVSLYFSTQSSAELNQAKSTLPSITSAISKGETSVDVYNPKGWVIDTWPHGSEIPDSCTNLGLKSCICICPSDTKTKCDNGGTCADNSGFLIKGDSIAITNPPITLNIDKTTKIISQK